MSIIQLVRAVGGVLQFSVGSHLILTFSLYTCEHTAEIHKSVFQGIEQNYAMLSEATKSIMGQNVACIKRRTSLISG